MTDLLKSGLFFLVMNRPTQEMLISRRQAAEILSVTTKTIYRYERRGLLKPHWLNSRVVRYRLSEINSLIENSNAIPR